MTIAVSSFNVLFVSLPLMTLERSKYDKESSSSSSDDNETVTEKAEDKKPAALNKVR
jgi:hypothetical protein